MHDETTYLKYVAFLRCQKGCDIKMSFIKVDNITKTFKVAKRNSGLKAALKSFFKREYKIVEAVKNERRSNWLYWSKWCWKEYHN